MFKICVVVSLAAVVFAETSLNHLCWNRPDGTMRVNPNNCNSYISCLGNIAFIQYCQEGLHYSEERHICDYPENVNCKPGSVPTPEEPSSPERKHDPRCRGSDPNNPTTLSHESNCNAFYVCDSDDWAILMKCPFGTHFNANKKMCDFPETAGCA